LWDNAHGAGSEAVVLTCDGNKVKAVLNGRDDKMHVTYAGSMRGSVTGRTVNLTFRENDGIEGWLRLELGGDDKTLSGSSGDTAGGPLSDYVCTR
jgi:hypothetical protein